MAQNSSYGTHIRDNLSSENRQRSQHSRFHPAANPNLIDTRIDGLNENDEKSRSSKNFSQTMEAEKDMAGLLRDDEAAQEDMVRSHVQNFPTFKKNPEQFAEHDQKQNFIKSNVKQLYKNQLSTTRHRSSAPERDTDIHFLRQELAHLQSIVH